MNKKFVLGDNLFEKLKDLPIKPGVYRFLDTNKTILYIGKAKNLRARIKSYFQANNKKTKKLNMLLKESYSLDLTLTNSELEALLLEQHLIKQLKPKFNVQFKDDKGYPWIKLDTRNEFPSVRSHLGTKNKIDAYFGPFPSSYAIKQTLVLIQKIFKIRNCSENFFKNRSRPCLQFEIGRCSAPCVGAIKKSDYLKEVRLAEKLLRGQGNNLERELYDLMDENSVKKNYERAADYRDKLSALREIQRNQSISGFNEDRDAITLYSNEKGTFVGVTQVRGGWILNHKNFTLNETGITQEVLESFLFQYYFLRKEIPPKLIIGKKIQGKALIEGALSKNLKKRVKILTKLGKKDRGLLSISKSNTQFAIKRSFKEDKDPFSEFADLKRTFKLSRDIKLIDSFDISHQGGKNAVGGCVVYDQKGKNKSKYRLYNIHKKNAGNDIASMMEVVLRRYSNKNNTRPDLILIDGGFTHLKAVEKTLFNLGYKDFEILSISKGVRRKAEMDLFHNRNGKTIIINRHLPSHLFLQRLRDESHRLVISNQRKKQVKSSSKSSLDNIYGIGKKKKRSLLRYFGSVSQISKASYEDLVSVKGIGKSYAELIYKNFH